MLPKDFVGCLYYNRCDDWLILAHDSTGQEWYVITEMWPEWLDIPESEQERVGAVEKYMLPIARNNWMNLDWKKICKT